METKFMNTENSKRSESTKLLYEFTDKLDFKNSNKNMALANLSIYYTWKNIKSEYNNNEFKISAQLEMINLIYPMDPILYLIYRIILSI